MTNTDQNPRPPADERAEHQRVEAAQLHVRRLQAFYIHAGVFAGGMVIIFLVNLLTNVAAGITGDWWAWWSAWAFIGWGLGIAVHGLVVRLNRPLRCASSWEERQIDKVLGS
jgi:hypothetical protein